MGRVELVVRHEGRFRRLYAVKRLHPHYLDDPEVVSMFLDEARLSGLIRHPNVASVLDVVEDSGEPCLIMEYVEGVSLAVLMAVHVRAAVPIPLSVALRIVIESAEALDAAHELTDEQGRSLHLVHRDVSPQNILIGYDGHVRLTDFGIAKALDQSSRTATGVVKGKMGYVSPEQLRYEPVDRRSDLFSLGIVLFELVAGRRLYAPKDGGPRRVLEDPPPDLGAEREKLPPALVELAFELLAKDVEDRPPSARDVAERLREILEAVELVEDPVDLAEYVKRVCATDYDEERRTLAVAMQMLDEGRLPPWPNRSRPAQRPERRWRLGIVAAALTLTTAAVSITATLLLASGGVRGEPIEGPASARDTASVDSTPDEAGSDEAGSDQAGSTETRPEPEANAEAAPTDEADAGAGSTETAMARSPARTRKNRPRPSSSGDMSADMTAQQRPRTGPLWRIE